MRLMSVRDYGVLCLVAMVFVIVTGGLSYVTATSADAFPLPLVGPYLSLEERRTLIVDSAMNWSSVLGVVGLSLWSSPSKAGEAQ